ncbi:MAG: hypothetical protein RIM23_28440 [Coleofasciculus sp. G3-WIS-01]
MYTHPIANPANAHTLHTAITHIEKRLNAYITRFSQSTPEPLPDIDTFLNTAAQTSSPPLALTHLCNTFHLTPFERNTLLLCAASALIPYFPQLCIEAQGSPQYPYPTFNLALHLFGNPAVSFGGDEAMNALTLTAPLQYWQLVNTESSVPLPLSPLQLDNSILLYLLGQPYQDTQLMHLIQPVDTPIPATLQPSHQQIADRIAQLWQTNPNTLGESTVAAGVESPLSAPRLPSVETRHGASLQPQLPIIQLCNTTPSAASAIITTVASLLNRPLKRLEAHRLPTSLPEVSHLIRRWHRDAILTQSILFLDCQEFNTSHIPLMEALCHFLKDITTPLIISTPQRLPYAQRPLLPTISPPSPISNNSTSGTPT